MKRPKLSTLRKRIKLSWFKAALAASLLLFSVSLLTPFPAQLVQAFRGEQEQARQSVPTTPPPTASQEEIQEQTKVVVPLPASSAPAPNPVSSEPAIWGPERSIAMPTVQYPPFPPVLPTKPAEGALYNITELARGLNLKTQINFLPGTLASKDRVTKENYQMTLTLNIKQPEALTEKKDFLALNPHLESMLPGLKELCENAKISPWYGQVYVRKQTEIRKNLTSLTKLLDRHNFYDTETILEMTHPQTRRKVLWLQSEMDVVSDGSDGDRLANMPEKILKSTSYQPSTSYRWKKQTDKPNPLLSPWQQRLATLKANLAKAPASEKASLRSRIDYATRVISELKSFSFLISEYDPFIVIPLGIVNQGSPFSPKFGDYAVVIVGDRLFPAIVGDAGPRYKTGEGSLRLSKEINPKSGIYSRPVSDLKVSYLIFPGSAESIPGPPDYARMHDRCQQLLDEIGGIGGNFKLHEWEDLLAPKTPREDSNTKEQSLSDKTVETDKTAEASFEKLMPGSETQPSQETTTEIQSNSTSTTTRGNSDQKGTKSQEGSKKTQNKGTQKKRN